LEAEEPSPDDLRADLALARAVARELVGQHRLSDGTYSAALERWGEPTMVELLTLVGYFAMVCWLMNVARTPRPTT
jgi:4-carboxymuconolactone decarboxylase